MFPVSCEDVKWFAKKKNSSAPTGSKCLNCVAALRQSFPWKAWEELCADCEASTSLKTLYSEVVQRYEGKMAKNFTAQDYHYHTVTGTAIERSYVFLTCAEFKEKFKVPGGQLGIPTDSVTDEKGQIVQGHVLIDDSNPYLKIKAYTLLEGSLREALQPQSAQLRPAQASQFKSWYEQDLRKTGPAAFQKSVGATSFGQIPELVKKFEEAQAAKEAETAAMQTLIEPQLLAEARAAQVKEEEANQSSGDSEEAELAPTVALPSELKAKSKAKAKPKPKDGKAKPGKPKSLPKPAEPPTATAATATASEVADGASTVGGRSGGRTKKLLDKAMEWPTRLKVSEILQGHEEGRRPVWQCQQTVEAMEKHYPGHANLVTLKAHYELCEKAQERNLHALLRKRVSRERGRDPKYKLASQKWVWGGVCCQRYRQNPCSILGQEATQHVSTSLWRWQLYKKKSVVCISR